MSNLRISCLYPILFSEGNYIKHRFNRYSPGDGFKKLTADSCPPRYAHLLHVNSRVYYITLVGNDELLAQAWERIGLSPEAGRFVAEDCGCNLIYDARYGMFLMDFHLGIDLKKVHPQ